MNPTNLAKGQLLFFIDYRSYNRYCRARFVGRDGCKMTFRATLNRYTDIGKRLVPYLIVEKLLRWMEINMNKDRFPQGRDGF